MEFDYGALMGSMNLNDIGTNFGVNPEDINMGAVNEMLNGGVDLQGATSLYGGLGGGIGLGEMAKNVVPATSPVIEIPGVDNMGGNDLFGGSWDGAGRMAELNGVQSMMANRPGIDPSLTTVGSMGNPSDIYGMLSRGTQGLGGLMGLYNSWQMMNIMNKNEARNQKGFDLANERYNTNHANVKKAFAV